MKIRTTGSLMLMLAIVATPAWASPPMAETPQRVALDVKAPGLGPDLGPRIELQLYEPLKMQLERQNFEVEGPGEASRVVLVSIDYLDEAGRRDYAVHIDLVEQQEPVALTEWFVCMACNDRRLVEQTVAGFALAVTGLVEHSQAEAETEPLPAPMEPPAKPAPIGPLGYLGAGVGGGGLLILVLGVGLTITQDHAAKATKVIDDPYRPGAEMVVGVGVTSFGFGVLALASDLIGRRIAAKHGLRPEFTFSSTRMSVGVSFDF